MTQKTLQERFNSLEHDYQEIISTKYVEYSQLTHSDRIYVDHAAYQTWSSRVKKLLEDSYGKESDFYNDFIRAQKGFHTSNHYILSKQLKPVFDAAKADLTYSLPASINNDAELYDELNQITKVLKRFPAFCRQLSKRYNDRATIEIIDEYDVQDLVHALLTIYFDDIRPEEFTPSYAGRASRQDFLLKKEKIVIEVKKTRKNLGAKEVGEELIIDMARYRTHPDCDTLVCFVYDPECRVNNPKGLIADLESQNKEGKVRVIIAQF